MIDPGRAFGTGSHATTRLCLECLLQLERGSLLDVGCGSGVLAIAAAKAGFRHVVAVDAEPAAIDATNRNAAANGVRVDARLLDALRDPLPPAELAVANIALDTVRALGPRLGVRMLVSSGYLASEQPRLEGFAHARRRTAEGWAADVWRRPE